MIRIKALAVLLLAVCVLSGCIRYKAASLNSSDGGTSLAAERRTVAFVNVNVVPMDHDASPSLSTYFYFANEAQTTSASFRANTCRFAKAGGA